MKKYLIASFLMICSMSFKQQQDSTKTKDVAKFKEDSIRKADLAEKRRQYDNSLKQTKTQKDFSEQFKSKPDPKSNYIYKDGRIVGGKTTVKTFSL
jgi:hypothetical protein